MCILKYRIRTSDGNAKFEKKRLNSQKSFLHSLEGFFDLCEKRLNANNGRWKRNKLINPAWVFKKNVMWLCAMGWHNLPNQQPDFVAQHLKCCYGHSEVPEQSLSSKYFCIIASQNGLPRLRSQTADIHLRKQDRIYCVSSALSKCK